MTNGITIKFPKGLKNLDESLIGEINKIGLYNTSEEVVRSSQEKAPYDTGTLKKSIGREPENITKRTKKVIVGPRDVDYAVRREFENYKNPDRKFYMKRTYKELPSLASNEFNNAVRIVLKLKDLI